MPAFRIFSLCFLNRASEGAVTRSAASYLGMVLRMTMPGLSLDGTTQALCHECSTPLENCALQNRARRWSCLLELKAYSATCGKAAGEPCLSRSSETRYL